MLYTQLQDARGKRIRAASLDNKPSLKRLQAKLEEKAQVESALAAASAAALGQTDAAATSNDTVIEDEDVRIERELAQMKADRLKAIQALPRSVWADLWKLWQTHAPCPGSALNTSAIKAMARQQCNISRNTSNECNLASFVKNAEFQLYSAVKLWLFPVNNAGRIGPNEPW